MPSAVGFCLKPAALSIPAFDVSTHALSIQDGLRIPDFEPVQSPSSSQRSVIDLVLRENNLYSILGLPMYASTCSPADKASLRRAYLSRSRECHPDKFPNFPPSTLAFQKLSVAYDVLSTAPSKRMYDAKLRSTFAGHTSHAEAEAEIFSAARPAGHAHDTFRGVLGAIFADFMEGEFEMIRMFLGAIKEFNPALNIKEDTIESILNSFRALRELILVSQTYARLIHRHLLRLLEIQHALRQLPYFDICGRLRLTLQLARVALEMPVAVDRAVCEREEAREREEQAREHGDVGGSAEGTTGTRSSRRIERHQKGGILPRKLSTIICLLVVVLEHSERVLR